MYVCVHMHFVCVCVCGREEVVQKINPGPHAFMHAGQVLYYWGVSLTQEECMF